MIIIIMTYRNMECDICRGTREQCVFLHHEKFVCKTCFIFRLRNNEREWWWVVNEARKEERGDPS